MKIIVNNTKEKYLDLARELRHLWSLLLTVILMVIGEVPKGLERKLRISQK